VGPADFTFRYAPDVIRGADIPAGFAFVLSGHIHRHQVLTRDLAGRHLAAPVLYPGSIERTALAEMGERKGFMLLDLPATAGDAAASATWAFRELPARPMLLRQLPADGCSPAQLEGALRDIVASVPGDAVLAVRVPGQLTADQLRVLSAAHLRTFVPETMNLDVQAEWTGRAERFKTRRRDRTA
jgi:DNA repair exonuclease SbcCD nuclease subunit